MIAVKKKFDTHTVVLSLFIRPHVKCSHVLIKEIMYPNGTQVHDNMVSLGEKEFLEIVNFIETQTGDTIKKFNSNSGLFTELITILTGEKIIIKTEVSNTGRLIQTGKIEIDKDVFLELIKLKEQK